jgi:Site-specific DNA methylase
MVKESNRQGYTVAQEGDSIDLAFPDSKTRGGRVGKGIANTLVQPYNQGVLSGYRIRRLTPLECSRLQGWEDEYFYKAQLVNSDSQLYKQYGNGVTVTVVKAIAKKLI